jgi:hypothetical protein
VIVLLLFLVTSANFVIYFWAEEFARKSIRKLNVIELLLLLYNMDWIDLDKDRDQWMALVSMVMYFQVP